MKKCDESWKHRWLGEGIGKYWKRRLAKARRRYIKAILRGDKGKCPLGLESEVNWKGT